VAKTGSKCRQEQHRGQSKEALAPDESFLRNAMNISEILRPETPVVRIAPNRFPLPVNDLEHEWHARGRLLAFPPRES